MRKSRAKEFAMEATVGAFMFMVLLALGFFTIILSTESIFKDYYELEVEFDEISGLRDGDKVLMRGVDVGKVKSLQLVDLKVHVLLSLESDVILREGYKVEILPASALGGRYLSIYEGPPGAPPIAKGVRVQGEPPVDLLRETTVAVSKLKDFAEQLSSGEGTIGKLFTEDEIYEDIKQVTANLREVSDRLANGESTLGRLLSKDDSLYQDLNAAAKAIRDVTDTISSGEGTLGKLMKDDEIYEEVKILLSEIRATVDDFRETAPITSFTSIFFGAF